MINSFLIRKKIKPLLLSLAVGYFAYSVGKIVPDMLTISMGTLMHLAFYVAPSVIFIVLIALWNPSPNGLTFNLLKLPSFRIVISKRNIFKFAIFCVITCLVSFWVIAGIQTYIMVGQIIFFSSILAMFYLGTLKPELGPIVFFTIYPFLWFAEGRLNSSLYWLFKDIPYLPEWLQSILIDFHNIDIVMLMFAIGFMLFTINNSRKMEKTVLDKFILLLLIWVFVSAITANDHLVALEGFLKEWLLPVCFFYATLRAIKRKNGIREIMIALVVLLFVSCLLNFQNTVVIGKSAEIAFGVDRAMMWTIIAYQVGPWVVLIVPLAISMLFNQKEVFSIRLLSFLSILLGLAMSVWEMQRKVALAFLLLPVLFFTFYPNARKRLLLLFIALTIAGFIFVNKLIDLVEAVRPGMSGLSGLLSNIDRWYLLKESWNIIKQNPFLGIGPGGFKLLNIGYYFPEVSSHNIFTEIALESGIIASAIFTMIYFYPIFQGVQLIRHTNDKTHVNDLKLIVISLVLFASTLLVGSPWVYGTGAAVFCILGLLVGSVKKSGLHVS